MAVVNTKSARVTNADAVLSVLDRTQVNGGRLRRMVGLVEAVSGDSIGSTFRMVRVHSSWSIQTIRLYCDAITTCAGDIGLYQTAANGGAVVDADAYASAQSLATAIVAGANVQFEARDIDKVQNQVFQDAGLTADPNLMYDIVVTLTAAAGSAGTIILEVEYVSD